MKWGILSTGWISQRFVVDLLVDPSTRGVDDVTHEVVAIASRSVERVQEFIDRTWKEAGKSAPSNVKAYGAYEELYRDSDVQAIYVGTPHSHHYQNVARALRAGKAVICEKALTVNAAQAQQLADIARENKTFFMEAVWLRFTPVAYKVQEIIKSGVIGNVTRVQADLSVYNDRKELGDKHRMFNPDLAGGALLDLGPYPWTWLALTLFPSKGATSERIKLPKVSSSIVFNDLGTDNDTSATIEFTRDDGSKALGIMTCSVDTHRHDDHVVIISGEKGYINVSAPTYRPERITCAYWPSRAAYEESKSTNNESATKVETIDFTDRPGKIWGFAWEADEVARCVAKGKLESDRMPLAETVLMMDVFDEVRRQNAFKYPSHIETTDLWQDELQH